MSQAELLSSRKRPLALSVRISFILMLAAVLPLLITVGISELVVARPALITQANQTMETDADTRIQLIDRYFTERALDAETLSQVPTVQGFLALPPTTTPPAVFADAAVHATYALAAGKIRDAHYITWWIFYPDGTPSISYPPKSQPHHYGQFIVPPEELQALKSTTNGQPVISPAYYDPALKKAFVDIYSPIYQDGKPNERLLGFMRASLDLDYIWDILQQDQGINRSGSSFLLDQNGVRIGDTNRNSNDLFTAVAKVPDDQQAVITAENWYNQSNDVPVHPNDMLSNIVQGKDNQRSFSLKLKDTDYQAAQKKATVVPWTFFVVSTSSSVTQVADQQLITTLIVAIVVALLAAAGGWWVSGRISRPIMRSVDQLRESSESLNVLAKKQQSASSEQLWVVDSVQVGLQSVQYYTDATRIAAHKLGEVGMELEHNWHRQNFETVRQGLQQVISAAGYIEKATHYQGDSGQKLSTAIKVTTQVNEQLADGAISATEAASQLEQVVNDLRNVVGQ